MAKYNIQILLGTQRNGNLSSRVAHYIKYKLSGMEQVAAELIDLADYPFPILEERYSETAVPLEGFQDFKDRLQAADAIIIVSPEYKNGIPGALKNALDYLPPGHFKHKPVGICSVSSGPFGGLNCLAQLRLVCISMAGIVIPTRFPVSFVQDTFKADNTPFDPEKTDKSFLHFWEDFFWYTKALVAQRNM